MLWRNDAPRPCEDVWGEAAPEWGRLRGGMKSLPLFLYSIDVEKRHDWKNPEACLEILFRVRSADESERERRLFDERLNEE